MVYEYSYHIWCMSIVIIHVLYIYFFFTPWYYHGVLDTLSGMLIAEHLPWFSWRYLGAPLNTTACE